MDKRLSMSDIKKCFHFGFSDDYPSGFVSITKKNAEKLQKHGWIVSFHTEYYLNTISAEFKGFSVGLGSWMDNLTAYIEQEEHSEVITIENRVQLDKFLQLIESIVQFTNVNN